jgi:hypothetical protein
MFQPGISKVPGSGRKKGSSVKASADEICKRLGCDPIAGMAAIAMDKKADLGLRARMYAELAKYLHPQRRAVDNRIVDADGNDREIVVRVIYEDVPAKATAPASGPASGT